MIVFVLLFLLFSWQIPHIIVCGHYDCGAVKAASSNTSFGSPLDNWLMSLRDVKRLHGQVRTDSTPVVVFKLGRALFSFIFVPG